MCEDKRNWLDKLRDAKNTLDVYYETEGHIRELFNGWLNPATDEQMIVIDKINHHLVELEIRIKTDYRKKARGIPLTHSVESAIGYHIGTVNKNLQDIFKILKGKQ